MVPIAIGTTSLYSQVSCTPQSKAFPIRTTAGMPLAWAEVNR